jgi:23S rRNA pseudouridine2605 synthase
LTLKENSRRTGLARVLSKLGYCSRSQAAELIRSGQVRLNGTIRRDPETPVRLKRDRIFVSGHRVEARRKIYVVMNKPRGVITTACDEKGRDTVYSLLARSGEDSDLPWIAPVGRLDKASEGLLLMTNDSEWAAHITAPETHLEKIYHVQIGKIADEAFIAQLVNGVRDVSGEILSSKRACLIRSGQKNSWLEIVLDEGKNRHIRRLMDALGVETLRLIRVAIGPLQLGQLPKGAWRPLTKEEKMSVDYALAGRPACTTSPANRGQALGR